MVFWILYRSSVDKEADVSHPIPTLRTIATPGKSCISIASCPITAARAGASRLQQREEGGPPPACGLNAVFLAGGTLLSSLDSSMATGLRRAHPVVVDSVMPSPQPPILRGALFTLPRYALLYLPVPV